MDMKRLDDVGTALRDAFEYYVDKLAAEAESRQCDISCGGGQVDETKCMCTDCTTNNCCPSHSFTHLELYGKYYAGFGGGSVVIVLCAVAVCWCRDACCFRQ